MTSREKFLLAILLSSLTSWCCVRGRTAYEPVSRPPEQLTSIISLTANASLGMGIPVSATHALTVFHLTAGGLEAKGIDRTFKVLWQDPKRDLVLLEITEGKPFLSWVTIAPHEPEPTEALYAVCYLDTIWNRVVILGRYMGIDADKDMIMDGFSTGGMSGGAVLNAKGELVGILRATWHVDAGSRPLSVAAPVFGEKF